MAEYAVSEMRPAPIEYTAAPDKGSIWDRSADVDDDVDDLLPQEVGAW